jgi:membrane protein DedA with SNARE-associated domain
MFEWMTMVMDRTGLAGVALLMFLENVFPPIPSELIMPMAGFTAARSGQSLLSVTAAGTFGSVAGALFWYWLGRKLGRRRVKRLAERHGRWMTLCPPDVDRAVDRFQRYGVMAVLVGRLVPALRSLISVPAGIARMPLHQFFFFSAIGSAVWTALLAGAGYLLEDRYEQVADYLNPVSNVVFAVLAIWYVWRVVKFDPKAGSKPPSE